MKRKYIVHKVFSNVDEIFKIIQENINAGKSSFVYEGDEILFDIERMKTFLKSKCCISCNTSGTIIKSERNDDKHPVYSKNHINFYALVENKEVLMTVDHIVLKSTGGIDDSSNYNTMCAPCNMRRGNKFEKLEDFLESCKLMSNSKFYAELRKMKENIKLHNKKKYSRIH